MKNGIVNIMGIGWEYILYTEDEFLNEHPDCEDSGALTLPHLRQLIFTEEQIDIGTVRHEVRHAFIAELCLESAELELEQYEEIQCTLDQNRWEQMDEASIEIYENLVLT